VTPTSDQTSFTFSSQQKQEICQLSFKKLSFIAFLIVEECLYVGIEYNMYIQDVSAVI
jgi:hypothetical protein